MGMPQPNQDEDAELREWRDLIKQVGDHDSDNFALVPWWWPYRNAEQGAAARRVRTAAK